MKDNEQNLKLLMAKNGEDIVDVSNKIDKLQGESNAGKVLEVGDDGYVVLAERLKINDYHRANDENEMLSLTGLKKGDIAIRTDVGKLFVLASAPANVLTNWVELVTPQNTVFSVAGKTGYVTLNKDDVGLNNVDNTSDNNKPISSATQAALNSKAAATHNHSATEINSGTLGVPRGGTGLLSTPRFW